MQCQLASTTGRLGPGPHLVERVNGRVVGHTGPVDQWELAPPLWAPTHYVVEGRTERSGGFDDLRARGLTVASEPSGFSTLNRVFGARRAGLMTPVCYWRPLLRFYSGGKWRVCAAVITYCYSVQRALIIFPSYTAINRVFRRAWAKTLWY